LGSGILPRSYHTCPLSIKNSEESKRQKAKMAEQRDLNERLLQPSVRIIKLVESLPRALVGKRKGK
jgi:hypothetical protein